MCSEYNFRLGMLYAELAGVDRTDDEPQDGAEHSAVIPGYRDEDPEPSDELLLYVAGLNG